MKPIPIIALGCCLYFAGISAQANGEKNLQNEAPHQAIQNPGEKGADTLAQTMAALEKLPADPAARTHFVVQAAISASQHGAAPDTLSKLSALAVREVGKEPRLAQRLILLGDIAAPNFTASDVHVVVAARRLLKLPDQETAPGQMMQRVNELVKDTTLHHPQVFHAMIRLVRSESRRARYYRPLRRLALELPISHEPYDFKLALQAAREAGEQSGNTIAMKAAGICYDQANNLPAGVDWRLPFSRLLLAAATDNHVEDIIFEQQDILKKADAAWRPRWETPKSFPGLERPRLMTRYAPDASLQLLRREINLLTKPPAYVQNSPRREILLAHQATNVEEMFTQFLEELPFIVTRSATFEDYHPDREPLIQVSYGRFDERLCNVVETELNRLPAAMRQKLRPQLLVAKYGVALPDRREGFLRTRILQGLSDSQFYVVERYAYLLGWGTYDQDTSALDALLAVFLPDAHERLRAAFSEGHKRSWHEPQYVNSAGMWED